MKTSFLILLAGVFALSACSKDEAKKASSPAFTCSEGSVNDVGIIGGEGLYKDTWLAKGMVAIYQIGEVDGESEVSLCTGSLVDRNIVLTAAHCLDLAKTPKDAFVVFSNQPGCDLENGRVHQVARRIDRIEIHESYVKEAHVPLMKGDIALIRLSEAAPSDYKPLNLPNEFVETHQGARLIAAGYGTESAYESVKKSKHFLNVVSLAEARQEQIDRLAQMMRGWGIYRTSLDLSAGPSKEYMYVDQTQGKGICSGDSGGPLLTKDRDGQYVVTGVASHVYTNPRDRDHVCGFLAAHTSVYFHKDWLESKFQLLRNWNSEKRRLFE